MIATTLIVVQLLLLTVAVIALFAMMGQLSNRISDGGAGSGPVRRLDDAHVGRAVAGLPTSFRQGPGVVVVFSTTCRACDELAPQASRFFEAYPITLIGVLVTSASEDAAQAFVTTHELDELPAHVDVGGRLSRTELGVSVSPAAVAVGDDGVINSAVAFTSYSTLPRWFESTLGDSATSVSERGESR